VPTLRLDLRDVRPEHCRGYDAVIHLAALCNDPLGDLDPELTDDINHRATIALARAAKEAGVPRFLFSSSCSLYGAGPGDLPLTETADFAPVTPYGESKIRSEHGLAELAGDSFSYRVSCDPIAAEVPEFRPRWTVPEGVRQLADAYRRHGLTLEALAGGRYHRLRRVEALQKAGLLDDRMRWLGTGEPLAT
jgi:hypothetical protein